MTYWYLHSLLKIDYLDLRVSKGTPYYKLNLKKQEVQKVVNYLNKTSDKKKLFLPIELNPISVGLVVIILAVAFSGFYFIGNSEGITFFAIKEPASSSPVEEFPTITAEEPIAEAPVEEAPPIEAIPIEEPIIIEPVEEIISFAPAIIDADNNIMESTIQFENTADNITTNISSDSSEQINITEGIYDATITLSKGPVTEIAITNLSVDKNLTNFIKVDDVPEFGGFVEVYAIDPTSINFTSAEVTVMAHGEMLYKCKNWDFDGQTCADNNWTFVMPLTPGESYTFTLTSEDPGFAENASYVPTSIYSTENATVTVSMVNNSDDIRSTFLNFKSSSATLNESQYEEYNFTINYPANLSFGNVNVTFEHQEDPSTNNLSLRVYENKTGIWRAFNLTMSASVDLNQTIDVSSYINTTNDINGIRLRYIASSGGANKYSRIDWIKIAVYGAKDNIAPNTTLVSPAVNYYNDTAIPALVTFNCSATDNDQLYNISLYITNSTNQSLTLSNTSNISGSGNWSTWNLNLGLGNYTWNCYSCDNSSNCAFATANRTIKINYSDTSAPTWSTNQSSYPANYNT